MGTYGAAMMMDGTAVLHLSYPLTTPVGSITPDVSPTVSSIPAPIPSDSIVSSSIISVKAPVTAMKTLALSKPASSIERVSPVFTNFVEDLGLVDTVSTLHRGSIVGVAFSRFSRLQVLLASITSIVIAFSALLIPFS